MKGVLDRIGFLVKDLIDLKGPSEVIGFGPGSIEGWRLFPSQISLIVDWGGYGSLSCDWLGRHGSCYDLFPFLLIYFLFCLSLCAAPCLALFAFLCACFIAYLCMVLDHILHDT